MGEVRHISVGERTGTRVRRATQCPACLGAAAGTLRVFILTVLLFLASGILPSAHNPAVSMWYGGAVGPGLVYAEELEPKRYNDVWLHGLEKRVSALLAPVYGAEHVVVQASIGEGKEGARPPVSLAVIIDTSVVPGFPTSPEGVRAEQERLASLISHAAGLKSARGDAIAISFLLFSGEQGSEQYLMYGLAGVVVLLGGIVCLLLGRKNRQKIDTTHNGRKKSQESDRFKACSIGRCTGAVGGQAAGRETPGACCGAHAACSTGRSAGPCPFAKKSPGGNTCVHDPAGASGGRGAFHGAQGISARDSAFQRAQSRFGCAHKGCA